MLTKYLRKLFLLTIDKSVVMPVGPRWNCRCAEFNLGLSILKFVDNIKYLGIYMKVGSKFSCCYTQLNSTENYGRRCLTPLSPHRNYILS